MPNAGDFNAVLAAQSLNPSIFTQPWLVKYGLFGEADFQNSMYSPLAVNVPTSDLLFVAIPEKIQVAFAQKREDSDWCQKALQRTLGAIAKELFHTPFLAIGFNMEWTVKARTAESASSIERKHFLSELNPLAKHFQTADCRFGFYLSQPFAFGRLKLDIKPVSYKDSSKGSRLLFNFHLDLGEDKIDQISKFLTLWPDAYKTSLLYANELEAAWS